MSRPERHVSGVAPYCTHILFKGVEYPLPLPDVAEMRAALIAIRDRSLSDLGNPVSRANAATASAALAATAPPP